jgi:hypothetical protein
MQLMVMLSDALACWRDFRQADRDERSIRMPWCAGVISGKLIASCLMLSNAIVCWRGLLKAIECGEASEAQRVPTVLRQADRVVPQVALSVLPPNRRVQLTPLRGPKIVPILKADLGSIVIWFYWGGAADAQHVRR